MKATMKVLYASTVNGRTSVKLKNESTGADQGITFPEGVELFTAENTLRAGDMVTVDISPANAAQAENAVPSAQDMLNKPL